MLVLSRHRDEQIMIGEEITVTVVEIRGDKCRLGVHAPVNVPVHRREVYDAIKRAGDALLSEHKPKPLKEPKVKVRDARQPWKDILYSGHIFHGDIVEMRKKAKGAGYPYYEWNSQIYRTSDDTNLCHESEVIASA